MAGRILEKGGEGIDDYCRALECPYRPNQGLEDGSK